MTPKKKTLGCFAHNRSKCLQIPGQIWQEDVVVGHHQVPELRAPVGVDYDEDTNDECDSEEDNSDLEDEDEDDEDTASTAPTTTSSTSSSSEDKKKSS